MKKLLLLTDMPPCQKYTGGQALEQPCSLLPEGSAACFVVLNRSLNVSISPHLAWMPVQYVRKPMENAGTKAVPPLGDFLSYAVEAYNSSAEIPRIIRQAVEFGRKFKAEAVWCVLQGQTMIRLARPVSEGLGVPLLTQVWDPPHWWLRDHKVAPRIAASVLKEYDKALAASAMCATASWAMSEQYEKDYGIQTVPVIASIDERLAKQPAKRPNANGELIIALAGQLYARAEWNTLLGALNSAGWKIAGRDVRLWLLGHYMPEMYTDSKMRLEWIGWHSQQEAIEKLSQADILYCPYWFDADFKREASLCFPSKVTVYLAAGRPILFHGPDYASPAKFLRQHNAASLCHALDGAELLRQLTKLATDEAYYAGLAENGNLAFRNNLTFSALRTNFAKFLGAEPDELISLK